MCDAFDVVKRNRSGNNSILLQLNFLFVALVLSGIPRARRKAESRWKTKLRTAARGGLQRRTRRESERNRISFRPLRPLRRKAAAARPPTPRIPAYRQRPKRPNEEETKFSSLSTLDDLNGNRTGKSYQYRVVRERSEAYLYTPPLYFLLDHYTPRYKKKTKTKTCFFGNVGAESHRYSRGVARHTLQGISLFE